MLRPERRKRDPERHHRLRPNVFPSDTQTRTPFGHDPHNMTHRHSDASREETRPTRSWLKGTRCVAGVCACSMLPPSRFPLWKAKDPRGWAEGSVDLVDGSRKPDPHRPCVEVMPAWSAPVQRRPLRQHSRQSTTERQAIPNTSDKSPSVETSTLRNASHSFRSACFLLVSLSLPSFRVLIFLSRYRTPRAPTRVGHRWDQSAPRNDLNKSTATHLDCGRVRDVAVEGVEADGHEEQR
eukprot:29442-Rhodomonas_salina.1